MKKLIVVALVLLVVGGCCNLPTGVKSSLYTAQLTLEQTARDVAMAQRSPWKIPDNATVEGKLALREAQVDLLVRTMEQANKNLKVVIEYTREDKFADLFKKK